MMLTIFSNKLDFYGPFKVTTQRRFVRRIHAGKLREKSAMFPLVAGGCGFISEFGHRSGSSGTRCHQSSAAICRNIQVHLSTKRSGVQFQECRELYQREIRLLQKSDSYGRRFHRTGGDKERVERKT